MPSCKSRIKVPLQLKAVKARDGCQRYEKVEINSAFTGGWVRRAM